MRMALVGYGIWGELILETLSRLGVPAAVCDCRVERGPAAMAAGATGFVTRLEDLPSVDGVVIATPASDHAATVERLDRLGVDVPLFVEKPMTASLAEARRLEARTGSPLFVMHIWTYHAGVRRLKALVDEGAIGTPTLLRSTRANWTSPRTDVDCIGNLAPHDLSIFRFLLDRIPPVRHATGEFVGGRLVSCVAALDDADSPPCVLEVSNRYGEKRRELRVHGSDGVLVLPDDHAGALTLIRGGGCILPDRLDSIPYEGPPALEAELSAFVHYLSGGRDGPLWDVSVGADVVRAVEEVRNAVPATW